MNGANSMSAVAARLLRRDDSDDDCIRFLLNRETKELATSPFLLNHQAYVGISFQRIGKMEREIIASPFRRQASGR